VLVIKCAVCKQKLWKYQKIGKGEVLRCYKKRIQKIYFATTNGDSVLCQCGNKVGIDKGNYIKMIRKAFIYSGTKNNVN